MYRFLTFLLSILLIDSLFHVSHVHAFELSARTMPERLGALLFGAVVTLIFLAFCKHYRSSSFFYGMLVASGFFASVDIIAFHWVFKLHRLTSGPEANVLEPILVVAGLLIFIYGYNKERLHDYNQ